MINKILDYIEQKINLIALSVCAAFVCFWMVFIAKWYYFRYTGGWDTAYFIQSLVGLAKGSLSPSVLDGNFLADHCHLFAFILAPIYWLFPDPLLLQHIKILAFFSAAYVFFLILKKHFDPLIALTAMIAFCLAPANVAMLRFAFSYEALAIPLIMLIFKAFDDKKYVLYLISCFLLLLVKEQMPLVVIGFGVFALLCRSEDRFKWAIVPLLMGLAVFVIEVFVLLPYVRAKTGISQLAYWNRYLRFGNNPGEIFAFLITHPGRVWAECFSVLNIRWYADLFGVWGGLSFFSPFMLIPALPLFFKMALSSEQVEHSVTAVYYSCVFTPFVFLATWHSFKYIQHEWRLRLQLLVLGLMFLHAFNYFPLWTSPLSNQLSTNLLATQRFIDQIPPQASVLSGRKAMTYLAHREKLYAIKDYFEGHFYVSGKKFNLSSDIDYALVDFSEFTDKKIIQKVNAFNFDPRFRVKESIEDVTLYVKKQQNEKINRLIDKSTAPFSLTSRTITVYDNTIALEALVYPREFPHQFRILPVTMVWKSLKIARQPYSIVFRVRSGNVLVYEKRRVIGASIYTTDMWAKDEYVKENYSYLLPHLMPGDYVVEVEVYGPQKTQRSACNPRSACQRDILNKRFKVL